MTGIETFPAGTLGRYDYAVMVSSFQEKLLLSRHKGRDCWELQGGHIEPGETPEEAAKRELFEESGAISFVLTPLCDYRGEEPGRNNYGSGMVFQADIQELGPLPEFEMAERKCFEKLPDQLTYPEITRAIFSFMNGYYMKE